MTRAPSGAIHDKEDAVEVLYRRCAGLDVHKDTVVACIRCVSKPVAREVRTFGTTTKELLALSDWLQAHACTHVGMEATGVYWKPVWHVLESHFELVLANAQHIRNVPGRKTDVKDAAWIADLLAHGLIRGSFVPPLPVQDLRDLTRTRKQLVREVSQHTLRIQKVLEDANIKVAGVLTDILGKSGRAMLAAIIDGVEDSGQLADLARGTARKKRAELVEALRGRVTPHHRTMLKLHLNLIKALESALEEVDLEVGKALEPISYAADLLKTVPGVSDIVAHVVVAEVGVDMSRFPTSAHIVSWAGLCPRNDESAGKRRSTRARKGATWLKTTLITAAWATVRKKDSYLRSQFLRLKSRRGPKKAILAVAASMLTAMYYMLRDRVEYRDLGNYVSRTPDGTMTQSFSGTTTTWYANSSVEQKQGSVTKTWDSASGTITTTTPECITREEANGIVTTVSNGHTTTTLPSGLVIQDGMTSSILDVDDDTGARTPRPAWIDGYYGDSTKGALVYVTGNQVLYGNSFVHIEHRQSNFWSANLLDGVKVPEGWVSVLPPPPAKYEVSWVEQYPPSEENQDGFVTVTREIDDPSLFQMTESDPQIGAYFFTIGATEYASCIPPMLHPRYVTDPPALQSLDMESDWLLESLGPSYSDIGLSIVPSDLESPFPASTSGPTSESTPIPVPSGSPPPPTQAPAKGPTDAIRGQVQTAKRNLRLILGKTAIEANDDILRFVVTHTFVQSGKDAPKPLAIVLGERRVDLATLQDERSYIGRNAIRAKDLYSVLVKVRSIDKNFYDSVTGDIERIPLAPANTQPSKAMACSSGYKWIFLDDADADRQCMLPTSACETHINALTTYVGSQYVGTTFEPVGMFHELVHIADSSKMWHKGVASSDLYRLRASLQKSTGIPAALLMWQAKWVHDDRINIWSWDGLHSVQVHPSPAELYFIGYGASQYKLYGEASKYLCQLSSMWYTYRDSANNWVPKTGYLPKEIPDISTIDKNRWKQALVEAYRRIQPKTSAGVPVGQTLWVEPLWDEGELIAGLMDMYYFPAEYPGSYKKTHTKLLEALIGKWKETRRKE